MTTPGLPDPYDGQPIVKVTTQVTNAGDGLSKAMATDALRLHMGEPVTLLLDAEVAGVNVRPLDKEDPKGPLVATYVLRASGRATFVDPTDGTVQAMLDAQQKRNDEAAGRQQLPYDSATDDPARPSAALAAPADGDDWDGEPSPGDPGYDPEAE